MAYIPEEGMPAGIGGNLMALSGKHRPRRPQEIEGKAVRFQNRHFGENNFMTKRVLSAGPCDTAPQLQQGPQVQQCRGEKARHTWESPK